MSKRRDYVTLPELVEMWMKAIIGALLVGMTILSQAAVAQVTVFGPWLQAQGHREQPRGYAPRDQRGDRRVVRPEPDQRRQGRLTDDERRDLRRDIDQANRDIYRRKFKR